MIIYSVGITSYQLRANVCVLDMDTKMHLDSVELRNRVYMYMTNVCIYSAHNNES